MRHPAVLLSVAFMLMLGGCLGGAVRTVSDHASIYTFRDFVYLTSGRDTRVVVRGNPFNMDRKAFETAVTDAMQGQHFGPMNSITTLNSLPAVSDGPALKFAPGPQFCPCIASITAFSNAF